MNQFLIAAIVLVAIASTASAHVTSGTAETCIKEIADMMADLKVPEPIEKLIDLATGEFPPALVDWEEDLSEEDKQMFVDIYPNLSCEAFEKAVGKKFAAHPESSRCIHLLNDSDEALGASRANPILNQLMLAKEVCHTFEPNLTTAGLMI